jgi:plastocyanin
MRRLFAVAAVAFAVVAIPLAASAANEAVSIEGTPNCGAGTFCYTPSSTSAKVGDKVTWTNNSSAPHTVTRCTTSACNGTGPGNGGQSGPSSPQIAAGGKFSMTFTKPGDYVYYCQIHGYSTMHGTIHVAAASTTPAPTTAPTTAPTSAPKATTAPQATSNVAGAAATPAASSLPTSGRDIRGFAFVAATLLEIGLAMVLWSSGFRTKRARLRSRR